MKLSEAIELVLDEAETSALGDLSENENSQDVMKALKIVRKFLNWEGQDIQLWEKEWNPEISYTDFCDDEEKMEDFNELSKDEFLSSYSYITEEEYNLTRIKMEDFNELSKGEFLSSYPCVTEEEYNLTRMKQKGLT